MILEKHQPPQPTADRLLPLNTRSNGGLERFPSTNTCFKGRTASRPPPLHARWGIRQGTGVRVFLSGTAHPCASLYSPPVPTLPTLLVCLGSLPPPQPLMLRASCLCSKPSIPAQEQSQSAYRCAWREPAKGTQLQRWLLSPPSLVQTLLCTRQSQSYFWGWASMTNPTCSSSSRVSALEHPRNPQVSNQAPKGLHLQHIRRYFRADPHTTKMKKQSPPQGRFLSVVLKDAEKH